MFIQPTDFQDFQTHLALLMDEVEVSMPEFPTLDLPQLDLSRVEMEWQRIWKNIPEPWKLANNGLEFTVGEAMAARGLSAKHPVVLVPGIISTVSFQYLAVHARPERVPKQGLESWSTSPDYRAFFRKKLWGGFSMISQVTFNRDKWIAALMLDPVTGLDPPGVKVRAAEGIDAASSFIQGYWLWCVTARKRMRGGGAVKARFEALSELRRIQQGEPGVTDLEEDLDEVESKSTSNARNSLIIKSWVIGRMVKWWSGWSNVGG